MSGLLRERTPIFSDQGGVTGMCPLTKMPRYYGLRMRSKVGMEDSNSILGQPMTITIRKELISLRKPKRHPFCCCQSMTGVCSSQLAVSIEYNE
jgi:hypothetical protein